MAIYYWAGDTQRSALVVPIGVDDNGTLTCLKSDKLSSSDIKKLKGMNLSGVSRAEAYEHLSTVLQTFKQALAELKKGRYQILEELEV